MTEPDLQLRIIRALRWVRQHGWTKRYPRTGRDGLHTWQSARGEWPAHRIQMNGDTLTVQECDGEWTGWMTRLVVRLRQPGEALDALATIGLLPDVHSASWGSGYRAGVAAGAAIDPPKTWSEQIRDHAQPQAASGR
ncbi:hypothetical protein [Catenuloplanes japonicus]|uniref:hypothetical protein n=1 Tax=Catenuloplanes japonicus TaxID=33876 RepID=UPI0005274F7C|nr:hypothetical protein [Catenuloplanes japonicus]